METICARCGGRLTSGSCPACAPDGANTLRDLDLGGIPTDVTLDAVTFRTSEGDAPRPVDTPREAWVPGTVLFDEYVVERLLGEGGMGSVYLVESRLSQQKHAVKRTRCVDPEAREALLAEVQTWRDLPLHPNLTTCHFFRTLGDDVLIFAEHVDGGSLDDAICARSDWSIRDRIDVAIQLAFGLEAAHAAGYVHQDIKPANVLLTSEGVAKVTDFGLARTQQLLARGRGPAGLTPAYCSPEQAFRDQPITAATDIWSWGVTVLELFVGDIRWNTGIFAPGVLKLHREGNLVGARAQLPESLAEILDVAFRTDIESRWRNAVPLTTALLHVWSEIYGSSYPRDRVRIDESVLVSGGHSPQTDPRQWLDEDVADRVELGDVGQLALFERAERRLSAGVGTGEFSKSELGMLLIEKAKVHQRAHDWSGALHSFEKARRLLQTDEAQATISAGEGRVQKELRRFEEAERSFGRAIELFRRAAVDDDRLAEVWVDTAEIRLASRSLDAAEALDQVDAGIATRTDPKARELKARLGNLRGNIAFTRGERELAVGHYRNAVDLYEELVLLDARDDLRPRLASTYFNHANGLTFAHQAEAAETFFLRSLRLYDTLLEQPGGRRLSAMKAQCLVNFGTCLRRLDRLDEAAAVLRQAMGMFERLVHLEGRRDLEDKLTTAYLSLSTVAGSQQNFRLAVELSERVVEIRRRLVAEGRDDMRDRLAATLGNLGYYLAEMENLVAAVDAYRESIEIRERLLANGDEAVRLGLARQFVNRAHLQLTRGIWDEALADAERGEALLAELRREPRTVAVEAVQAQIAALVALNDEGARAMGERAEQMLRALSGAGLDGRALGEVQVRALSQRVLVRGAVDEVADTVEAIRDHPWASRIDKMRGLFELGRFALKEGSSDARKALDTAVKLGSDDLANGERLALRYYACVARGEQPTPDVRAAIEREAARSGRVVLREIVATGR